MSKSRATSFATRQDLARFAIAVTKGSSPTAALKVGDNGVGSWGDPTWDPKGPPICALPAGIAKRNAQVRVTLSWPDTKPFICVCRDISPSGVIDLNPAALIAAGLGPDDDINDPNAQWEFVQGAGA